MQKGHQESQDADGTELGEEHEKLTNEVLQVRQSEETGKGECTPLLINEMGELASTDMEKAEVLQDIAIEQSWQLFKDTFLRAKEFSMPSIKNQVEGLGDWHS